MSSRSGYLVNSGSLSLWRFHAEMEQGKAHALKFAQNGFDVVLADMQDPDGEVFKATVAEIEKLGARALAVNCNVTSDDDMKTMFEKAWDTFVRLDVVVANAGVINFGYTWELTDAQVQKVIDIDLIGTWRTDKYAALYMRKQGFGRIINISSTSGMYGTPQLATYCMAKWGVRGMTKTLAQELKGTGIVVNTACLPTALKWFPDKSGSISGLVQAGASCGPFIMSPYRADTHRQLRRADDLPYPRGRVPHRNRRGCLDDSPLPRGLAPRWLEALRRAS